MNSDVSDGWEREGDNQDYFETFAGGLCAECERGKWVMTTNPHTNHLSVTLASILLHSAALTFT